ncbi:MAG: phosphoribosyltransferase, partial [Planctomycetes bacterium]|nr:phosphoribosyltransferase [Planctomycetota bacterium]
KQMIDDVRDWSYWLPDDLLAVAGVPRSGVLPAFHLALHRNIHLVTLEVLKAGLRPWERPLRRFVTAKTEGRVLIVEDSLNTGGTLQRVRSELGEAARYLYGAVYFQEPRPGIADFLYRRVPLPRCFEWNLFHSSYIECACLDLDGVLCSEPPCQEQDRGPEHQHWLDHLEGAAPMYLPGRRVKAIVTSRLEKYRPQTEAWLQRHGVRYGELVMSPHPTAAARRAAADHAYRKAEYYRHKADACLFVESSLWQAREIAQLSEKPVICTESMQVFHSENSFHY